MDESFALCSAISFEARQGEQQQTQNCPGNMRASQHLLKSPQSCLLYAMSGPWRQKTSESSRRSQKQLGTPRLQCLSVQERHFTSQEGEPNSNSFFSFLLSTGMVVCNWVVILSVCITVLCVFDPTGRTFVKLRATKRRQRNLRTYNLRSVVWVGGWCPRELCRLTGREGSCSLPNHMPASCELQLL